MAASVTDSPSNYVSAYRPMNITVERDDPAGSQVSFIRPATASDVSTLGNGLAEGDILVSHAVLQGSVIAQADQTVHIYEGCGDYNGVHTILNAFDVSGTKYMVIDSADYGAITPSSGYLRIWLENYAIHCRVYIHNDPGNDPEYVDLGPMPVEDDGSVTFDIGKAIRRHFSDDMSKFCKDIPGSEIIQNAHSFTATFYTWAIAETYDVPGETDPADPFDGDHDVDEQTTYLVAVNAIHPYQQTHEVGVSGTNTPTDLTWEDTDLSDYVVVDGERFLTYAPRMLWMHEDDRFRVAILTREASNYQFASDWYLRVRAINEDGTTGAQILAKQMALGSVDTAAVSIAVGPADLSPFMTLPASGWYRFYVSNFNENILSETFDIRIHSKCSEVRRPIHALNKLGGVDSYTMMGREIMTSRVGRAIKRKPMGGGSGFDWTRRVYKTAIERIRRLSTLGIERSTRQWLVETFMESPNTLATIGDSLLTPVDITTESHEAYTTETGLRRMVVDMAMGVDNYSQEL